SFLAGEELKTIKLLRISVPQPAHKPLDTLVAGRKAKFVNRRLTGTPYRPPKGTPLIGVLCW
ncbi:hypothetical protein, partial [Bradyrhizobium sp. Mp27]|uniref:hypothetical protein n=1 Tax=Bradyrhizobium sp. Mp27 TaxID=3042157 RepID=UPI00248C30C2